MSALFPSQLDTIIQLPNVSGTQNLDNPDHALVTTNVNQAVIALETAIGTTVGTNMAKLVTTASDQLYILNTSGTPRQIVVNGTYNNSVFGTPAITGGTANAMTFGTPAVTGGTMNNAVFGTPSLTGGTYNAGHLGTTVAVGIYPNGTITGAGTSGTIDWSKGDVQTVTLGTPGTFVYTNQGIGQRLTLLINQNATGGFSVTLPTSKYSPAGAPTFGTAASALNAIVVLYDGTNNLTQAATSFS